MKNLNGSQYFKVGPVDGDADSYYPYCDAPLSMAELWTLEHVENETGIEKAEDNVECENVKVKGIYDLQGRKIEAITDSGIYIINGKKVLVK